MGAASNDNGLMDTCLTAWYRILCDEKALKDAEAKMAEAEGKMSEWQLRKKEEAKAVFARVAAANDSGLMDTCITAWYRILQDEKALKEAERKMLEAEGRMSEFQKRKKDE